MTKRKHSSHSVSKRLAKVERELKKDKPEVKTLDVLINPLVATGQQQIFSQGINTGTTAAPVWSNYDLTDGFIQGLLNTGGNIDGNYCKLTSMDLRIYLDNFRGTTQRPTSAVRLMIVRIPDASALTPAQVQSQVLEYGAPATYGSLCYVSPLKRNSTINGGYDVMYDRVHTLSATGTTAAGLQAANPVKSTKYVHFKKKWAKGLTLRFSGSGAGLVLEQNRIFLFAMDPRNVFSNTAPINSNGVSMSFVNRIRYSDE